MVIPSTHREVKSDDDQGLWLALKGNTLAGLTETRVERMWCYVRRKATTKRKIEKAILKRLQDQGYDATVEHTRWKPRFCEISINPHRWSESALIISKHETQTNVKQRIRLCDIFDVTKMCLPARESLIFPVPQPQPRFENSSFLPSSSVASPQSLRHSVLSRQHVFDSDDEESDFFTEGREEYRHGHLVLKFEGFAKADSVADKTPFYSEWCCGSTRERDAWVQFFQDFQVIHEMAKVRQFSHGAVVLRTQQLNDDYVSNYLDFFASGTKRANKEEGSEGNVDDHVGGTGHKIGNPPKGDLLVQFPNETGASTRRILTCPTKAGWIRIAKTIVGVTTTSEEVHLRGYLISALPHYHSQFQLIRIDSEEKAIKFEIKKKGDNQAQRNSYIEWLLYVQAMERMLESIRLKEWTKVEDRQTNTPCYVETRPSSFPTAPSSPAGRNSPPAFPALISPTDSDSRPAPRIAFAVFPSNVAWANELAPSGERQVYRRLDGRPAADVTLPDEIMQNWNIPRQHETVPFVYDLNELYQQPKDDVFGYGRRLLKDSFLGGGGRNLPEGISFERKYSSELALGENLKRSNEYLECLPRRPPCYPAPWELFDNVTLLRTELRTLRGKRIEFRDFVLLGFPVTEWWGLPVVSDLVRSCAIGNKDNTVITEDMYDVDDDMPVYNVDQLQRLSKRRSAAQNVSFTPQPNLMAALLSPLESSSSPMSFPVSSPTAALPTPALLQALQEINQPVANPLLPSASFSSPVLKNGNNAVTPSPSSSRNAPSASPHARTPSGRDEALLSAAVAQIPPYALLGGSGGRSSMSDRGSLPMKVNSGSFPGLTSSSAMGSLATPLLPTLPAELMESMTAAALLPPSRQSSPREAREKDPASPAKRSEKSEKPEKPGKPEKSPKSKKEKKKKRYKKCWCSIEKRGVFENGRTVSKVVLVVSKTVATSGGDETRTEEAVPAEELRSVSRLPENQNGCGFCVSATENREYQFYAHSESDRDTWIETLTAVINRALPPSPQTPKTQKTPKSKKKKKKEPSPSPESSKMRHAREVLLTGTGDRGNVPSLLGTSALSAFRTAHMDPSRQLLSSAGDVLRGASSSPPASAFPIASPLSPTRQLPIPRSLNPGSPSFRNMRTVL